jgi:starch phosphorylase
VAEKVNNDPDVQGKLRVLFLPNYCVSQAEKIIPAADLSEQISTAGMEASGTGNMKMSLNGALTIGTLDGANVEIMEEVGEENIFIFGLTADQVTDLRNGGYRPKDYYDRDAELRQTWTASAGETFRRKSHSSLRLSWNPCCTRVIITCSWPTTGPYVTTQEAVGKLFLDKEEWARISILNTARMGKFSSDRSVMEYANTIWGLKPLPAVGESIKANDE